MLQKYLSHGLLVLSAAFSLAVSPIVMNAGAGSKTSLRVAIYEYIPGYHENDKLSKLRAEIKRRFELKNPDIDLVIDPTSNREKFYEFDSLKSWLTQSTGEHFHVAEIDTLLLGDLIRANAVWPISATNTSNLFTVGLEASKVDGTLYGIPHLLCGYFLFARDPQFLQGAGQKELVSALQNTRDNAVDILGEFNGSWTLPALYLDAWMDRNPTGDPAQALTAAIVSPDPVALDDLKKIIGLCNVGGTNACFTGMYHAIAPDALVSSFALGHANAFIGYSERLHHIRKIAKKGYIGVRSAPLGDGDAPLLFSDAFVIGKNCADACRRAAESFAKFMNTDEMMEYYLLARDLGDESVARYLLPATISAFAIPGIKGDEHYSAFEQHIRRAKAYPNHGFVEHRRAVNKKLKCEIDVAEC